VRFYEGIDDARVAHPELDIPKHSPHALRHTAASWLVQAGVPLYGVQRLLGHESFAVTARYAHLAPDAHGAVEMAWERLGTHQGRTGVCHLRGWVPDLPFCLADVVSVNAHVECVALLVRA
jgi:hypothetical protein